MTDQSNQVSLVLWSRRLSVARLGFALLAPLLAVLYS